jgi:hypothetical protein
MPFFHPVSDPAAEPPSFPGRDDAWKNCLTQVRIAELYLKVQAVTTHSRFSAVVLPSLLPLKRK